MSSMLIPGPSAWLRLPVRLSYHSSKASCRTTRCFLVKTSTSTMYPPPTTTTHSHTSPSCTASFVFLNSVSEFLCPPHLFISMSSLNSFLSATEHKSRLLFVLLRNLDLHSSTALRWKCTKTVTMSWSSSSSRDAGPYLALEHSYLIPKFKLHTLCNQPPPHPHPNPAPFLTNTQTHSFNLNLLISTIKPSKHAEAEGCLWTEWKKKDDCGSCYHQSWFVIKYERLEAKKIRLKSHRF